MVLSGKCCQCFKNSPRQKRSISMMDVYVQSARVPLVLQESRYSCTSVFILAVLKLTVCALWPFFSCIHRVSASWQQPFCTFSSWHHSAGCSQRPGSPTWRWRERFGPGSSASAFCVWAGVSNIMFHCTSPLPFSLKVSGQGGQVTVRLFSSATLILSVGQPDLHSIRLFIVMVLCSSQALWGLGK